MLDNVSVEARPERRVAGALDANIIALATAVPPKSIGQEELKKRVIQFYPQFAHMESIYSNTGIDRRYYVENEEWYVFPHTWEERTASFHRYALELLEEVALDALDQADLRPDQIDAIIVQSTTGLAVPALDAMLMNRLAFSPQVERMPMFGLGCGGGVAGLTRASRIASTIPGGNVLFLTVELCTLCARINDQKAAAFVSGALFGDGAAGVIIRAGESSDASRNGAPLGRIRAGGEHFWGDTEYIMGWDVMNDGFGVVLSAELPTLVEKRFDDALDIFLERVGMRKRDFAGYMFHPGGAKVLDALERILKMPAGGLKSSRDTLRTYGNMSSPTALFVLKQTIGSGGRGRHLLGGFGPGFSAYFSVIDL